MTTPDIPAFLPGTVSPPVDAVEKRSRQDRARLDESMRKDLTNAVVGQGGKFRATLVNGGTDVLAIRKGRPEFGSKQVMRFNDMAGNPVFQHDEAAGYGLSAPIYTYFMGSLVGSGSTAGVPVALAESDPFVYNPAWQVSVLIRGMTGAATSWSLVFQVNGFGVPTVTSSPFIFTGGAAFMQRIVLLPKEYMNVQNVNGKIIGTPNGTGTLDAWPIMSRGGSKAIYDLRNDIH